MEEQEQKQKLKLQEKIQQQEQAKKKVNKIIDQKNEKIQRLQAQLEQLEKEDELIYQQHAKAKQKYQEEMKKVKGGKEIKVEKQLDHEEHDKFVKKVDEKVSFHISKYLAPIEKVIQRRIEDYERKVKDFSEREQEYQKTQFASICVKLPKEEKDLILNRNDTKLLGHLEENINDNKEYTTVFRIQKTTTFKEIKRQALIFWNKASGNLNYEGPKVNTEIDEQIRSYEIWDEFGKKIQREEEEVERYFLSSSDFQTAQIIIKQKESDKAKKILKQRDQDNNEDLDQEQKQKQKNLYYTYVKAVFESIPLLKQFFILPESYIMQKWKIHKSKYRKGFIFDDNHCCFLFLVLIMLLLLILQFENGIKLDVLNVHNEYIKKTLLIDTDSNYEDIPYKTQWKEIASLQDLTVYLIGQGFKDEIFKDTIHQIEYEGTLLDEYIIVGDIRLRQLRSKKYNCGKKHLVKKNTNPTCYYNDLLSNDHIDESTIGSGYYPWQNFLRLAEVNSTRIIDGTFLKYPSNGYIMDIQSNTEYDNYITQIDTAVHRGFLNSSIKGFIINLNLLNKNDGYFTFVELLLEQTPHGTFPKYEIITFIPNIRESENGKNLVTIQTLRLIVTVIQTMLLLYRLFCYDGLDFKYIFSMQGLLNTSIIVLTYFSINYEWDLDNQGLTEPTIFGVIFISIYIFFVGFFLMNMITATYVDEYRLSYLDQGYELEPDWTLKEKVRWLLSWLNKRTLQKCNLNKT